MSEFRISKEQAKLLAIGLYKTAVDYIITAKRENPDDYQRFKADYAKQAVQASAPVKKRRQSHTRPVKSSKPSKEFT